MKRTLVIQGFIGIVLGAAVSGFVRLAILTSDIIYGGLAVMVIIACVLNIWFCPDKIGKK